MRGRRPGERKRNMNRATTCCFTGHRPEKLPWREDEEDPRCLALKAKLSAALEDSCERGIRHFMCGVDLGAGFYFCEAVIALRERRPEITLEAVLCCEEQASHWTEQDRERYFNLVANCDQETMVQRRYDEGCVLRRNRYMVERSSRLIAVYSGLLGGTMYTISYAQKRGLDIVTLETDSQSLTDAGCFASGPQQPFETAGRKTFICL